ncbi:MAG: hypothetical protein JXR95_03940 [Deltaproteobacteria bacterium]|nr:hypothetical protein [Deltaproteobacteria bacterium]
MKFLLLSVFTLVMSLGCEEINTVNINTPAPGSVFQSGETVTVDVSGGSSFLWIEGNVFRKKHVQLTVPPVDGLGFIRAKVLTSTLLTVRSYLQGNFRKIEDYNSSTVQTRLGPGIMDGEGTTFASLCSEMMAGEELVEYMENPIVVETEIAYIPVTININATSVLANSIDVSIWFENGILKFYSYLQNVVIVYTSEVSGVESSGTAQYEWMEVSGDVVLTTNDSDLINMTATASDPVITDDGGIPQQAFNLVIDKLDTAVCDAIATTTRNSSRVVFNTLMTTLVPQVVLEFENPISQDTKVEKLDVSGENVSLSYKTLVEAQSPKVARGQGVLERIHTDESSEEVMSITFGSSLVNQIAYAVWDAGNTNNIIYTKNQLFELGMSDMGGYYDRLETSEINLLLPPILEWDTQGPYLVMGGIQIIMSMDGANDTTAHTAGRVPVKFSMEDNALVLIRDEAREVEFFDVGFDRMSTLVDPDKVVKLLKTAVPGVVSDLFSTFPIIKMTSSNLAMLNGEPGPEVLTILESITVEENFWRMNLSFEKIN